MNTYIALFRGINVGGNNILPMRDLVSILENLGLEKIKTYIQSGNAVFQSKKKNIKGLTESVSSCIEKSKNFKPKIMLLSFSHYQQAVDSCPFSVEDGKLLHLFFLESVSKNPDLDSLLAVKSNTEEYQLINNVFYLHAPDGIGRSKLVAKVEKAMGVPVTARNWNTVNKLLLLAENL